jgi:hypothetical protein
MIKKYAFIFMVLITGCQKNTNVKLTDLYGHFVNIVDKNDTLIIENASGKVTVLYDTYTIYYSKLKIQYIDYSGNNKVSILTVFLDTDVFNKRVLDFYVTNSTGIYFLYGGQLTDMNTISLCKYDVTYQEKYKRISK